MKSLYKLVAMVAGIVIMLASCGNAGARTDKNADSKTQNTQTKGAGVQELNAASFNSKVYDMTSEGLKYLGDKPAIVDFTATWCGPCQRISPILEELAKEYDGKIVIYKVDIDKNRDLATAFNISSIPAIMYIPLNGEPVMTVGARDKGKFKTEIETVLLGN
jgi:thioredoxin